METLRQNVQSWIKHLISYLLIFFHSDMVEVIAYFMFKDLVFLKMLEKNYTNARAEVYTVIPTQQLFKNEAMGPA